MLSLEERNDLRKRVLRGESLSLEEAQSVIASMREGRGAQALAAENKPKRGSKKPGITKEQLDQDLADLGL